MHSSIDIAIPDVQAANIKGCIVTFLQILIFWWYIMYFK